MPKRALLVDYGGVLTTDIWAAFGRDDRVLHRHTAATIAELEELFGVALR